MVDSNVPEETKVPAAQVVEKGHLKHQASGQRSLKLCTTGDTAVGKTCLIQNYMFNRFDEDYEATVLDVYRGKKQIGKQKHIQVEIQDCSGDDHLGVNRRIQYQDADVFLICVAANNPESLENVSKWRDEI